MPAGPAPPERRRPGRGRRLAVLGGLPEREVVGVALEPDRRLLFGAEVVRGDVVRGDVVRGEALGGDREVLEPLVGERAVVGPRADVEVDVALGRHVGVAPVDETGHELDHVDHVPGGPRLVGGRQDADRVVRGRELALVDRGPLPPALARRGGLGEDLVVDVGHVADERDREARPAQPAHQDVESDLGPQVPDVGLALHGGPAHVDADLTWHCGHEVPHVARGGVEQAKGHLARVPGRPRPGRMRVRRARRRGGA